MYLLGLDLYATRRKEAEAGHEACLYSYWIEFLSTKGRVNVDISTAPKVFFPLGQDFRDADVSGG